MVSRRTMRGALDAIKNLDFAPNVVFDVGAQTGTKPLYEAFPESRHFMFEPVEEHEERLKRVCESLNDATYSITAVGQDSGTTGLSLTKDLNHSGMVSGMDDYDPVRISTGLYRRYR